MLEATRAIPTAILSTDAVLGPAIPQTTSSHKVASIVKFILVAVALFLLPAFLLGVYDGFTGSDADVAPDFFASGVYFGLCLVGAWAFVAFLWRSTNYRRLLFRILPVVAVLGVLMAIGYITNEDKNASYSSQELDSHTYPVEEREAFIASCLNSSGGRSSACNCSFARIQAAFTLREYLELGEDINAQSAAGEVARSKARSAAEGCS